MIGQGRICLIKDLRKINNKFLVEGNIDRKQRNKFTKILDEEPKSNGGGGELGPLAKHLVGQDSEASGEYGIAGRRLKKVVRTNIDVALRWFTMPPGMDPRRGYQEE
jgi:hypothetical protein